MTLELRSEIWMGMVEVGEKSVPRRGESIGPVAGRGLQLNGDLYELG